MGYPLNPNGNWILPYMKGMLSCSGPIDNYGAGTTATWLIDPSVVGNAVENITISCNKIDLAQGDYLRIYDGDNDTAPLLGEYTGLYPFPPVTSTSSKILVKFISAATSPTAKGFLITYEAKLITAIKELYNTSLHMNLVPNPATGQATVKFEGKGNITVTNMLGQTVYHVENIENEMQIPLNNMNTGIYFVIVRSESSMATQKLIVK
jgi:hypothetical protein